MRSLYKVCIPYILSDKIMSKSDSIVRVTEDTHSELSDILYSEGKQIRKSLELKRKQISFNHVIKYLIEEHKQKNGESE